jgi:hypothetical protein
MCKNDTKTWWWWVRNDDDNHGRTLIHLSSSEDRTIRRESMNKKKGTSEKYFFFIPSHVLNYEDDDDEEKRVNDGFTLITVIIISFPCGSNIPSLPLSSIYVSFKLLIPPLSLSLPLYNIFLQRYSWKKRNLPRKKEVEETCWYFFTRC